MCIVKYVSCCFLQCQHFKVAVASVYHSPSVDTGQCIEELFIFLSRLSTCSQYVIFAGDLNIDLMQSTNYQRKYIACLTDFQLVQLIAGPSRVCALSSTLIDHVVCSSSFAVTRVLQAIGVSDHHVQIVELDVSVLRQAPEVRLVRAFRKRIIGMM